MAELAETRSQHFVARRQGVGECGFPATGTRLREDERRAQLGAEDVLEARHDGVCQVGEIWRAVVFHRNHHGALDALRYVGGTGDK